MKTIGLLIEGVTGSYQSALWPGIIDGARLFGVNVVCYSGGSLDISPQNPWEYQRNILFDTALKDNLDGYILAGSLGGYVSHDRFLEFTRQFQKKPVVSLIPIIESIPSVYVDNRKGMHDLLAHLIHHHQYTSFAFIRGPKGNSEAEERFLIFKDVLEKNNIHLDPINIVNGDFSRECGSKAVEYLLSIHSKVDVIVAAADEIALGALQTLQEKGFKIPDDIALVGFDDNVESAVSSPPLTTICQPVYDLGKKSVELICKLLAGEKIPSVTVLDTAITMRQSCGCFIHSVNTERVKDALLLENKDTVTTTKAHNVEEILTRIDPRIHDAARNVWRSFMSDVDSLKNDLFLKTIDRNEKEYGVVEKNDMWDSFFFEVWYYALNHFDHATFVFADSLLHNSDIVRMKLENRIQGFRRIKTVRDNQAIRRIGQIIANTLDIVLLFKVLSFHLPKLGIKTFYLLLYDVPVQKESKSLLKLTCVNGQRDSSYVSSTNSSIQLFIKLKDSTKDTGIVHIVEPLYFQKQCYGMFISEVADAPGDLYETIREYVSSALHSAFLIKKVQHQAEILTETNKELERLQAREHGYLEAINRELDEGRKIQKGFLPQSLPNPDGWELASAFVPARAMSGDFYDSFILGDKYLSIVIADVSGKDVSAALFMALTCTLIRILTERAFKEGRNPLEAVSIINEYIIDHYSQAKGRQMYTTLFFGLIDTKTGLLSYCNAGHYPPLLIDNCKISGKCSTTGPALGIIPKAVFKYDSVPLLPGTMLFAYTDGVIDARDPDGEQFTTERMKTILQEKADSATEKLVQIETALVNHSSGAEPADDITILVVKRNR